MCGIAGFVTPKRVVTPALITGMASTLAHRGPDDAGYWLDEEAGIALGHRRLSIVDLSPQGHQPMVSRSGRYVIALNGEVYNFPEIRGQLDSLLPNSIAWRGHSDTEVMLEAISTWGLEKALDKFAGMFAFALWDRERRVLTLVRDRLGEKPLYYGEVDGSFVFGSELKALRVFPNSNLDIDRDAVAALLRFGYIPSPQSIYRGIRKLEPGSLLSVRVAQSGAFVYGSSQRYWAIDRTESGGRADAIHDENRLVDELHTLLRDSVRRQMISDVPLGAFLSGGVDSSMVVALMQAQSSKPVRTFTIGFREDDFNEAHHAKAVAEYLGTNHTEFYVTSKEAAGVIQRLPDIYDEPFADSSQIPTFLVSRLTRKHVTVSLSGDGGDELFAGYPRYQFGEALWGRIRRLPQVCRWAASTSISSLSARAWDRVLDRAVPFRWRSTVNGHRLHRFADLLKAKRFEEMYIRLISQWQDASSVAVGARPMSEVGSTHSRTDARRSPLSEMRRFDIAQYLPDDLLVKVDRASMSVGLESRAPMLDHRLAEFAWKLPENLLVRDGQTKWILRRVLDQYVPKRLIDRPKAGFGMPVGRWLRGDLKKWAEDLLDERTIRVQGFLDPDPVRRLWEQHLSGTYDRQAYLWNVLMFQAWLGAQRPEVSRSVSSGAAQTV